VVQSRAVASALLAAVVTVALAGCNFLGGDILPRKYDPSDGVGTSLGDLDVRNALLVTDGEGSTASLVVSVVNTSDDDQNLSVQYESDAATATSGRADATVAVAAHSIVTLGFGTEQQLVLADIDTEPGALFPVYFQSGSSEGKELQVPVLPPALMEYSTLTPSPTPTPVPVPTPVITPVPTPLATPTDGTVPGDGDSGDTSTGDSVTSGGDSEDDAG